nr:hypothetical protein GCM10020093_054570 [Planobispora longispora]
MLLLGVGQGASIALALLIITLRAPDPAAVTALSAVAQSAGYVLAALGPFLVGVLREVSGGWTLPLLAGLGACAVQLAAGFLAAPCRCRSPRPPSEDDRPDTEVSGTGRVKGTRRSSEIFTFQS